MSPAELEIYKNIYSRRGVESVFRYSRFFTGVGNVRPVGCLRPVKSVGLAFYRQDSKFNKSIEANF